MLRRVVWACIVLALAAGATDRGGAARPKKPDGRILLTMPKAGGVTVAVAKIQLRGGAAARAQKRLKLSFGNARQFSSAVVLAAVKSVKTRSRTTYTVILVGLNGGRARTIAGARGTEQQPEEPIHILLYGGLDYFALVMTGKTLFENWGEGMRDVSVRYASVDMPPSLDAPVDFDAIRDVLDSPPDFDPIKKPSLLADPDLDTGHYDDGHAFGWRKNDRDWAKRWLTLAAEDDPTELQEDVEALYRAAHVPLPGCGASCPKRYTFIGPLHLDYKSPPLRTGFRFDRFLDVIAGSACGASPNTIWQLRENAVGLTSYELTVNFAQRNPDNVLIERLPDDSGAIVATVTSQLRLIPGATPQIRLEAKVEGPRAAEVTGPNINPAQVAVTVTPVQSC